MEEDILLPRKRVLRILRDFVSRAIEDEVAAKTEYLTHAVIAERLELKDVQDKLNKIAEDEGRHYKILEDIEKKIKE